MLIPGVQAIVVNEKSVGDSKGIANAWAFRVR